MPTWAKSLDGEVCRGRFRGRELGSHMTEWRDCAGVESVPGRVSGACVFTGTRVPVAALFENLASGATVEEFLDWFPGVEEWKVRAVLDHEAKALRALARS